ncbi:MAG: cytochrome c oxidase assembly protein [Acetobacteraceae bacterium]
MVAAHHGSELRAYAVIAGFGVLLAWLCREYPAHLPALAPWEFSWPEYLAGSVCLWWYARGLVRTAAECRPALGRQACFFGGLALVYAVLQTQFLYLAEHMFFLHRIQHLVLHHLGPFLIALAWPGETLARGMPVWASRLALSSPLRRACAVIQRPSLAAVLFVGLIFLWLYPPLHFRAMVDVRLYGIMDWTMVVDGIFFFCLVLDPRARPPSGLSFAARIVLAVSVQIPQIALGGFLAASARDLYPWYDLCGRVFPMIGARADQQLGAFVVLFPGGMMSAVTALIVLGRLWREERRHTEVARAIPSL